MLSVATMLSQFVISNIAPLEAVWCKTCIFLHCIYIFSCAQVCGSHPRVSRISSIHNHGKLAAIAAGLALLPGCGHGE